MQVLNEIDILLFMALCLFLLGTVTFVSGAIILLTRTLGKDVRKITKHTRKLAQKGLAQDIAGLVGNASALLTATNEMVRTSAGLGVLLLILGLIQILGSVVLMLYILQLHPLGIGV